MSEWRPFEPSREACEEAAIALAWSSIELLQAERSDLDRLATVNAIKRKWSPTQTDECPIEDPIWGGYCETDEQLRERIRGLS